MSLHDYSIRVTMQSNEPTNFNNALIVLLKYINLFFLFFVYIHVENAINFLWIISVVYIM